MWQGSILTLMFGGLVALDKTEAFQTMFSQPLVIGPIIGFLWGDLSSGLKAGILFQLIYLWVMPIGTAMFPDPAIGSIIGSCSFVILNRIYPQNSDLILLLTVVFTVAFSLLAGWALIKQRQLDLKLLTRADRWAEKGEMKGINDLFLRGLLGSFFRGIILTAIGLFSVFLFLKPLVRILNFVPGKYLQNLEIPIWGLGIGTMFYLFGTRRKPILSLAGMVAGIILLLL